ARAELEDPSGGTNAFKFAKTSLQLQAATARHRVAGIERQVQDDLLRLRQADSDQPGIFSQIGDNPDVLAQQVPEQRLQVPYHAVETNSTRCRPLFAAHGHELPDQRSALNGRSRPMMARCCESDESRS